MSIDERASRSSSSSCRIGVGRSGLVVLPLMDGHITGNVADVALLAADVELCSRMSIAHDH